MWGAAENGDGVVVRVKVTGEDLAYLSAASGDDDSHVGFYFLVMAGAMVGTVLGIGR